MSLAEVDRAIEELQESAPAPESFERLLLAVLSGSVDAGSDGGGAIADVQVAAIMRLATVSSDLLYASSKRREALTLVVERLGETADSVLNRYDIDDRTQADELCRRLARAAPDAFESVTTALGTYQGLKQLEQFRNRLLREINSDLPKVVVRPFLCVGGDVTEVLRQCLAAAIGYLDSAPGTARLHLDEAHAVIGRAVSALSNASNSPAVRLGQLLVQLDDDLEDHFNAGPYSKPAELTVDADLRRHPLQVAGLALSVPLAIQNRGQGAALGVEVEITEAIGFTPVSPRIRLAEVPPGSMVVEMQVTTDDPPLPSGDSAVFEVNLSWVNADGTESTLQLMKDLAPQDWTVDWERLRFRNPYSLDAVTTRSELIGRSNMLAHMVSTLNSSSVGSAYIYGQKRVGKTSLARVAMEIMSNEFDALCVYRDLGGITNADPSLALNELVRRLTGDVALQLGIELPPVAPRLNGSLAPLVEQLERVSRNSRPIVIALDEFDRLPAALYRRSDEGDAFFTGLRSISSIDGVGLLLVGGERMKIIANGPGVELNKFAAFPVDYIDRSNQWSDFEELVRSPTQGILEFTDSACEEIYRHTSGNPYYTKQLCAKTLELAATRRDAFIDTREVDASVNALLSEIQASSFNHYWEDYILDSSERRDEVTLNRRRSLLAFAVALGNSDRASMDDIVSAGPSVGLEPSAVRREVEELVSRGILVANGLQLTPRVRLFQRWLTERGPEQIILTSTELESAQHAVDARERLRVTFAEAETVVSKWGPFRGAVITAERLLEYLRQFEDPRSQRLIFDLVKQVQYIGPAEEERLLKEAWAMLQQAMKERHERWDRGQIVLSYVGGVGQGSVGLARSFARANGFLRDSRGIRAPEMIADEHSGATDVVVIDDFIGTGSSLSAQLKELAELLPGDKALHVFALAGMSDGVDAVGRTFTGLFQGRGGFHVLNEISSEPGPFDPAAGIYDREGASEAEQIARSLGERLEPNAPLGVGACCSLIVFHNTIPNNAPAILWSSSRGKNPFNALFARN